MKKTLWIIGSIVVGLFLAATIFYIVRKQQAVTQPVHRDSQAILSIAIDDLLLDNWKQLIRQSDTRRPSEDSSSRRAWREIFASGLHIPARVYFFSLEDKPATLFSIQRITNHRKWHAFLRRHFSDSILRNDGSFTAMNQHMALYSDEEHVVIALSLKKDAHATVAKKIGQERHTWRPVSDWSNLPYAFNRAHATYWLTDDRFFVHANATDGNIHILGNWQLDTEVPSPSTVRQVDTGDYALSFRSVLPLKQTPLLPTFLATFSTQSLDSLSASYHNYVDLQVRAGTTTQHDTIITYGYDDEFNSVEQREIQTLRVPIIESVWLGSPQLSDLLPTTFFYQFHTAQHGDTISMSTTSTPPRSVSFQHTDVLWQLHVDFTRWPSAWTYGPFQTLKDNNVKVSISAKASSAHTMDIQGQITY